MKKLATALLLAPLSSCVATSVRDEVASAGRAAAGFESMKSLVGHWSGTAKSGEEDWPITISYRTTSAGSAVLEVMYEGQEQEMISLYHRDGPDLRLTHYCTAGNQPSMVLTGSSETPERILVFELDRATNMATWREGHMHRATYTFVGPDHLLATWAYFEDGKLGHEAHFDLTRDSAGQGKSP
jgi:hypothetical protein